jgi:hypothetical protein
VLVLLVVCDLFDYALPPALFPPDCHRYGKKIDWRRAKRSRQSEWLQERAHWEEDSRRDCNKHKDDTIKDQDKALDPYISTLLKRSILMWSFSWHYEGMKEDAL